MSQITLKPLDDGQKPVEIPLGKTTIGRGPLLGCSDKKVSRNHAVLEVTSKGEVFLTPTHVNPCFYQPTADNPGQILQKDIPHKLRNGDSFSLLPRAYRYQVIVVGGPKEEKNADLNDFNKPCGKPNGSTGDGFVEGIKDSVKKVSNEEQSEKAIPEKPFTKEEENVTSNKNHSIEENLSKKPTDMIDEKSLSSSKENSETKKDKEVIEKEAILPEDKNITEINVDESSSSNKSQMEHSKVNDSSGENGMNSEDYSKPLPDKEAEEKDSISQDSFPKNCSPEKATEDSYEEKEEKKVNEESLESKRTDNCEESQKDELLDKSPTKEVEEEEKVNPLPSRTEITTTSKRGRRKGAATRVNKPPKRKVSSDAPAKPKGRKKTPKFQFDEGQEGSSQRQTPGRTSSRTNRQTRQGLSLEDFIVSDDEEWQSDRSTETKKKRRKRGSRRNDDSGSDWETEHKKSKKPVHKFGSGSESGSDWGSQKKKRGGPRGKRRKGKATSEAEEEIEPKASSAPKSDKPRIPCTYGKKCYRRNQNHTDQFCHPGDSDYASEPESTQKNDVVEMSEDEECSPKKECPYGDNCFRRNPQHKKDFKHTKKVRPQREAAKQADKKAKNSRNSEEVDNYDLNDSFLNEESDEYKPVDSGSDYESGEKAKRLAKVKGVKSKRGKKA